MTKVHKNYQMKSFVEKQYDPPVAVIVEWIDSIMQTQHAFPGWTWPQHYETLLKESMYHQTVGFLTAITTDSVIIIQSYRPDRMNYFANIIKIPAVAVHSIKQLARASRIELEVAE